LLSMATRSTTTGIHRCGRGYPGTQRDKSTNDLLEHAFIGYEAQRAELARRMRDIQRLIGDNHEGDPPRPMRVLSPEGRARIIAATKRRWARARRLKRTKK
jgi:hypothetical protein